MTDAAFRGSRIEVRPLSDDDLATVERRLTAGKAGKHRERLESQRLNEGVYLIAWDGSTPVGHVYLKFSGADEALVRDRLGVCPTIEDLWILPERRRRGIGSQLMTAVEGAAANHTFHRVGLGVSLDNAAARALYDGLDYRDVGIGYTVRYRRTEGFDRDFEEECVYLVKELSL